jgi:hypothetical protein
MSEQTQTQEQTLEAPEAKSNPWDGDQAFQDLLASTIYACPGSYGGDYAFLAWLYSFYQGATGAAPVPTLTALSPDTAPANADVTVDLTGTGFDAKSTVNIGSAYGLIPSNATATDLTVLVEAVNIAQPGVLAMSVLNTGGKISNSIDFTVT